jgi:hypothetical protein
MLRLTRRFSAGLQKIEDRTKDEKGEYRDTPVYLTPDHSPTYKVEEVKDGEGNVIDSRVMKDSKGRSIIDKPGKPFGVNDEAWCLEKHKAILEKCN